MKIIFDLTAIPAWLLCTVIVLMGLSALTGIINKFLRIQLKRKKLKEGP